MVEKWAKLDWIDARTSSGAKIGLMRERLVNKEWGRLLDFPFLLTLCLLRLAVNNWVENVIGSCKQRGRSSSQSLM